MDGYSDDVATLKRLIAQRDKWIVDNGHWQSFVETLPVELRTAPPSSHVAGVDDPVRALAIRAFNEAIDSDGYETSYDIIEKAIRATITPSEHVDGDYFADLVAKARVAAEKASRKFPQPNYVTLKIAEEAGEVVRGAVHYAEGRMPWDEVEGEIVQLLAMLIRFVTEGDEINGIRPPALASTEGSDNG